MKIFQELKTLGPVIGDRLLRNPKSLSSVFLDFYLRRDRFGIGSFYKIDKAVEAAYVALTDDGVLGIYIPPAMENPFGIHKILLDDYIKSIIYAHGFEINTLIPLIDEVERKHYKKYIGKTLFPVVGFLGIATKQKTYRISCLDDSKDNIMFESPARYIERFCGGSQILDKLYRWKTFQKYLPKRSLP